MHMLCIVMWLLVLSPHHPRWGPAGLITWLIARDVHTATAVSRNFFWTDVNLWPDEIPQSSLFVLSELVRTH